MRIGKRSAATIKDALNFWKTGGFIDEDQADRLNSSIKVINFDWKKLSMLAILFAIFSFIIAVTSIIPELMDYFKDERIQLLLLSILATCCYIVGSYRKTNWPQKIYSNEGIFFLGVLLTAAAVCVFFIVLEIRFNITSDNPSCLMLIASIIYVTLGIFLSSKLIWCFALLSIGGYLGIETGYLSGWGAYYLGMNYPLRFVLFGLCLIGLSKNVKIIPRILSFSRITLVIGLLYLFISLWIMSIFGNYGDLYSWHQIKQIELFHWSLTFALASSAAIYYGIKEDDSVVCNFGIIFLAINLYTRYFEYFWNSTHKFIFFCILGVSFWMLGIKAEQIFNLNVEYKKRREIKNI